jgi:hypothetical protein
LLHTVESASASRTEVYVLKRGVAGPWYTEL